MADITNSKVWDIKELSQAIKNTIENSFEYIKIKGEISKPSFPSSGHVYFSLKDETSLINATVWKWSLSNIGLMPEEGLEVICSGRLTTYPGRSSYQINVSKIEHAGEGALLKQLEERKKLFFSKGYFSEDLKQTLPPFPECIGVITSIKGSVIEDIIETIQGRWPCKVVIYSVPVQGSIAADKISEAVEYFNKIEKNNITKPDVLIIARGGGSVEDLWVFNEEKIIKAVFASSLPVVSAIGHETDTTLIDYVSDLRAPTPTKAAVIVTPNKDDIKIKISDFLKRINYSIYNKIEEKKARILFQKKNFDKLENFLSFPNQRLDLRINEKNNSINSLLSNKNLNYLFLKSKLGSPDNLFYKIEKEVEKLLHEVSNLIDMKLNSNRLKFVEIYKNISPKTIISFIDFYNKDVYSNYLRVETNLQNKLFIHEEKVNSLLRLLQNKNLSNLFDKGFVYIENEYGEKISELKKIRTSQTVNLKFKDGKAKAKIFDIKLN